MATLKKSIETGLRMYPSLYKTAADVMEQLFCVGGNGCDWNGGELICREVGHVAYENCSVKRQHELFKKREKKDPMRARCDELAKMARKEGDIKSAETFEGLWDVWQSDAEIARRMTDFTLTNGNVYPMSDTRWETKRMGRQDDTDQDYVYFTELLGLPDNIKPDWLAGAELMCKIIREQDRTDCRKNNLKIVAKVEKRIAQIKKSNGLA